MKQLIQITTINKQMIKDAELNENYIDEKCEAIKKEMSKANIDLGYLREKVKQISDFITEIETYIVEKNNTTKK